MKSSSSSSSTSLYRSHTLEHSVRRSLGERFADWVTRHHKVARHEIRIDRRRIYILPTAYGYCYALILLLMLIGALNYNNSMAFLFTFLLAGLGANAMWDTHRNLLKITVRKAGVRPVFAGDTARFGLVFHNDSSTTRHALVLQCRDGEPTLMHIPAGTEIEASLPVAAERRGVLRPGRFCIYTRFPVGLFQAWTWLEFAMWTHVYPAPSRPDAPTMVSDQNAGQTNQSSEGHEDFAGLRAFRDGDSPGHIAWKAMARNETVLTKLFSGETGREAWLDWDQVRAKDVEERLSILCAMVIELGRLGIRYGLRLPHKVVEPDSGATHDRRCLKALALFGVD